jgi:TRAP-type uncharacterized transport system substrate-binding protein
MAGSNNRLQQIRGLTEAAWVTYGAFARRWLMALGALTLAGWAVWKIASLPITLTVAVGPAGSERERFVREIARAFMEAKRPIRLQVLATKDTAEAARLLDSETVQLAVVRSDEGRMSDARSFAVLDRRALILVGRSELAPGLLQLSSTVSGAADQRTSGIPAAALIGKRIAVTRDLLGSNRMLLARVLAHSGLTEPTITMLDLPSTRIAAALTSQQADVVALVVDPAAQSTRDLLASIAASLSGTMIVSAPPAAEGLLAVHRDLAPASIAPGMFGGIHPQPTQRLATVAITDELIGDSDLPEATGVQLAKALLETRGRLKLEPPSPFEIELPPTDALRRFMPHSSVTANVADKSTSFLETYSDQIWLGLFALGLIGSSFAGVAAWLGLTKPAGNQMFPDEIRAIVKELDQARSVADVDRLRRQLREVTGAQFQLTLADDTDARDAANPMHWFHLVDALAVRRRQEIAEE